MICIYHNADLDGHCSGAIIKYFHPECIMLGMDYGEEEDLDFNFLKDHKIVYIVDFSFSFEIMKKINENHDLYWLDHHISAIKELKHLHLRGFQDDTKAACQLTWKYLSNQKIPLVVQFLGDYDTWNHTHKTLEFQYGMRTHENTHPENQTLWELLFNEDYDIMEDTFNFGIIVLNYKNKQNKKLFESIAYEDVFEGHHAIIVNKPLSNSLIFNHCKKKYPLQIIITAIKHGYKYSISTKESDIDCSAIAKKYGGGGHKGVAGFFSEERLI